MGFADDIAKFAEKAVNNANVVVRQTVIEIIQRLIPRTPVGDASYWIKKPPAGYVGGHARFNWIYSKGTRVIQENEGVDTSPGGAATISKLIGAVPTKPGDAVHYIQNSVPYIVALEDGHSRQAPNGMVALTAAEFQNIVKTEAGKLK